MRQPDKPARPFSVARRADSKPQRDRADLWLVGNLPWVLAAVWIGLSRGEESWMLGEVCVKYYTVVRRYNIISHRNFSCLFFFSLSSSSSSFPRLPSSAHPFSDRLFLNHPFLDPPFWTTLPPPTLFSYTYRSILLPPSVINHLLFMTFLSHERCNHGFHL